MPVAAGESLRSVGEFAHLIGAGGVAFPEPDVSNVGGISAWMRVARLAEAHHLPVTSHGVHELHVHLLAAVPTPPTWKSTASPPSASCARRRASTPEPASRPTAPATAWSWMWRPWSPTATPDRTPTPDGTSQSRPPRRHRSTRTDFVAIMAHIMIPTQPFGATRHDSTLTLFGAAAFSPESTGGDADRVLELLLHHGVNHIDTAHSYGNGNSEVLIGAWMAQHRDRFFLATKTNQRTAEGARAQWNCRGAGCAPTPST